MQSERTDLLPPKDDPFTLEGLGEFDGTDSNKPVYVAIKGTSSSSFPSSSLPYYFRFPPCTSCTHSHAHT